VHATKLAAFDSPNMPPLLTANIDFTVDWDAVIRPGSKPFSATVAMDPNVAVRLEHFDNSLVFFDAILPSTIGLRKSAYGPECCGV
jgi:hypothetical protein